MIIENGDYTSKNGEGWCTNGYYRIFVGAAHTNNSHKAIWANYTEYCFIESSSVYGSLSLHGAHDVPGRPWLDFDTEEDALIFKLKFS